MFSVVIAVVIVYISKINGMEDFDIERVLNQLQKEDSSPQRLALDQSFEQAGYTRDEYQQLIQNIARSPQIQIGFPSKEKDYNIYNDKDQNNKHGRYRYWPWRQIIYVKPAWLKKVYSPRKQNNYPLSDIKHEDGNKNLGDYSKVYLVLDPQADITESDVRALSNMVSSILKKPSAPRETSLKDRIQKKRRYKGFLVKDNRRRIRDSKEMYAEDISREREYKPKRPRGDYGGGGGRTAIPYIRHRGDIFEKE